MSGEVNVNGSGVPAPTPKQLARGRLTKAVQGTFLEAVAAGWTDTAAAELAGVSRRRFFALRQDDERFAADYQEAREQGIERLEDELRRRGLEGFDEETFDGDGKLVRRVRKTDTTALVRRLQALAPERYRDNMGGRLELTGRGGGPVEIEDRSASLADVVQLLADVGALDAVFGVGVLDGVIEGRLASAARELPPAGGDTPTPGGSSRKGGGADPYARDAG